VSGAARIDGLSGAVDAVSSRNGVVLGLLGVVWAALWLLTDPRGDFALNDDWVYALAVRSIIETGRFSLPSPSSANVIAQAYWGALFCLPFGFSFTALRLSTFVLGTVGVGSLYFLLRECDASRAVAFVGAMALATNPLYLGLADSFMTDVPFTALAICSLWLHVRGVRRSNAATMFAGFAIAVFALMVRQFALVLPLAFGAGHIARNGFRARSLAVAIAPLALALALHLLYEHWLLSTSRTAALGLPASDLVRHGVMNALGRASAVTILYLPYVGLMLLPFVACPPVLQRLFFTGQRRGLTAWLPGLVVALLAFTVLSVAGKLMPGLGNVLILSGLGPLTVYDAYVLNRNLPVPSFAAMVAWGAGTLAGLFVAAQLAMVLLSLAIRLVRSIARPSALQALWLEVAMLTMVAGYVAGIILINSVAAVFDRYVLLLMPPIAVLMCAQTVQQATAPRLRWGWIFAALLLASYGGFSVVATHDYMAFNRARWTATDSLLKRGATYDHINGGYEFNGWMRHVIGGGMLSGQDYFNVTVEEFLIARGSVQGYHVIDKVSYQAWGPPEELSVFVLQRD
jgi:4-amino-4-deoxy-L-arabinose transferase-like glycosyltransferase